MFSYRSPFACWNEFRNECHDLYKNVPISFLKLPFPFCPAEEESTPTAPLRDWVSSSGYLPANEWLADCLKSSFPRSCSSFCVFDSFFLLRGPRQTDRQCIGLEIQGNKSRSLSLRTSAVSECVFPSISYRHDSPLFLWDELCDWAGSFVVAGWLAAVCDGNGDPSSFCLSARRLNYLLCIRSYL